MKHIPFEGFTSEAFYYEFGTLINLTLCNIDCKNEDFYLIEKINRNCLNSFSKFKYTYILIQFNENLNNIQWYIDENVYNVIQITWVLFYSIQLKNLWLTGELRWATNASKRNKQLKNLKWATNIELIDTYFNPKFYNS